MMSEFHKTIYQLFTVEDLNDKILFSRIKYLLIPLADHFYSKKYQGKELK